jgi:hypothetical protein
MRRSSGVNAMPGLPKEIADFMERYGVEAADLWEVRNGAYAIKHKALERVAIEQRVTFDPPTVLFIDHKEKSAGFIVTGRMPTPTGGGRVEWATGEAGPGNNKNAYFLAMAEKRGKDRVTLKLLQAHGALYSEAEADELKQENGRMATLPKKDCKFIYEKLQQEIRAAKSREELKLWADANKDRINIMPEDWCDILRLQYEEQLVDLRQRETA